MIDPQTPKFPIRAYIAAHAPGMPGPLDRLAVDACNPDDTDKTHGEKAAIYLSIRANWAVQWADALIARLNNQEPTP